MVAKNFRSLNSFISEFLELIWTWMLPHLQKVSDILGVINTFDTVTSSHRPYQSNSDVNRDGLSLYHKRTYELLIGTYKLMVIHPRLYNVSLN